ncbi:RNA export factor Gle1 [Schizosaccharomyces japonicus yFS275]|uniref:mRNA export factor GLE1 n=1 Tax=Schizosaccharomyces japonicus (strain yFS275 / FY16936) TaxID=402676 RepID=B6K578_SCHJY|nr:RNA export factor Gle1 [Schizosaccharomyces japonicus yFS275]EEB08682.1 RNA export factor Gle1 [Schizosaccharomyces japonicus yFS275]
MAVFEVANENAEDDQIVSSLGSIDLTAQDVWDLYNAQTRQLVTDASRCINSLSTSKINRVYLSEHVVVPKTKTFAKDAQWIKKENESARNRVEESIKKAQDAYAEKIRQEQERLLRERKEQERKAAEERARLEEQRKKAQLEQEQQKQRADEERKRQAELDKQKREKEEQQKKDALAKKQFQDDPKEDKEKYWSIIQDLKQNVKKPVAENKEWKNYCISQKRKITPRIGQVTPSQAQIARITSNLHETFTAAKSQNETVYRWVLNFFCKGVVRQAEAEVSVNTVSAYPLASVCLKLCAMHPSLFDMLIARLQKKCPWVIPYVYDTTTEEGMKKAGFKRMSDGRWEQHTTYNERQCGIFAVYAAMIALDTSLAPAGWKFFARILNITPPPVQMIQTSLERGQTICAIVTTFLDVAGKAMIRLYKRQAEKLIIAACSEGYVGKQGGQSQYARLRIVGEDWTQGKGGLAFSFDP